MCVCVWVSARVRACVCMCMSMHVRGVCVVSIPWLINTLIRAEAAAVCGIGEAVQLGCRWTTTEAAEAAARASVLRPTGVLGGWGAVGGAGGEVNAAGWQRPEESSVSNGLVIQLRL